MKRPQGLGRKTRSDMGKPLSWKWKLTIGMVVFLIAGMGFVFTPSGQAYLINAIDENLETMPESERRDSELADRYLLLCWWRANVMLDSKEAIKMYKAFLGIEKDEKGRDVFETGKLVSKYVSPDGKTGWGPIHPRAPEAFYAYLELLQTDKSSQVHITECYKYYQLLYNWMLQRSPDRKVHPAFNQYWPKIKNMIAVKAMTRPPGVDMNAPLAPKWTETEENKKAP
jgi:hypothetical protein